MANARPLHLRVVLEWRDMIQFGMACQVLDEAAIPYVRHGYGTNPVEDPTCAFPQNIVDLRVRDEDFDRAHALLADTVGRGVVGTS